LEVRNTRRHIELGAFEDVAPSDLSVSVLGVAAWDSHVLMCRQYTKCLLSRYFYEWRGPWLTDWGWLTSDCTTRQRDDLRATQQGGAKYLDERNGPHLREAIMVNAICSKRVRGTPDINQGQQENGLLGVF